MRSRGTRGGIEKEGATEVEMKQDVKTPERRVILIGGGESEDWSHLPTGL